MRQEKFAQFRSVKRRTVRTRITIEQQASVLTQESRANIVDEEFPVVGRPLDTIAHFADPVKTNPVRGHEIEALMKIGKGSLTFDPSDDSRDVEQFGGGAEKRLVIGIEPEHLVAKMFTDIKEVTGAAPEIENWQRRRTIKPKVLRALDVNINPVNNVFEAIDLRRARPVRIPVAKISELEPIDVIQYPVPLDRMCGAAEMFERAREELCRKQFAKLA